MKKKRKRKERLSMRCKAETKVKSVQPTVAVYPYSKFQSQPRLIVSCLLATINKRHASLKLRC